jgi:broad specificity phosphatase PhoE
VNTQPSRASSIRLFLVRHAEVEARYHRVFGGRIDMELSPRGHEQAAALAGWLQRRRLDAIYASPMKRVQQTLGPLAGNGSPQPVVLDGLREVDFGDWTGLSWEDVRHKFQISAFDWLNQLERAGIPNAENATTFRSRVEPCVRQILEKHSGGSAAIVCHGGVVRMILAILLDLPLPKTGMFEIDYASVTHIEIFPHKTELHLVNFAPWRDSAP